MFAQWPRWLTRPTYVRRVVIKTWRILLRVQRATFANAVLVVRGRDGRILVLPSPSGRLRLPKKQLEAWIPITTQVEAWLDQLIKESPKPSLVTVDGAPGWKGVTFLYTATVDTASIESVLAKSGEEVWLEPDVAAPGLSGKDSRLILLCTERSP